MQRIIIVRILIDTEYTINFQLTNSKLFLSKKKKKKKTIQSQQLQHYNSVLKNISIDQGKKTRRQLQWWRKIMSGQTILSSQ